MNLAMWNTWGLGAYDKELKCEAFIARMQYQHWDVLCLTQLKSSEDGTRVFRFEGRDSFLVVLILQITGHDFGSASGFGSCQVSPLG